MTWIILLLLLLLAAAILLGLNRMRWASYVGGAGRRRGMSAADDDEVVDLRRHPRSKSEAFVVSVFEKILGREFPTVRPAWLRWRGRRMELDGYNKDLAIAVEFSGPLHTKYYPAKESYEQYTTRLLKDKEKIRQCAGRGVKLIVIDMSVPRQHMYNYVYSRLYDLGAVTEKPFQYIPATPAAEPYTLPAAPAG